MARMKSAKSSKRSPTTKSGRKPKSVDEYFVALPPPAKSTLNKMRAAIRSVVPKGATEIISYGIPAFRHNEILVWYAAFADHYSLFPKASVIAAFQDQLKGLTISKGTIQFPADKPLPIALIKKLVKARVAQTQSIKRPRSS
jgi:uncharacterized protein YdhG (YjbR/CyaY superfamily)